jgi:hypothetical protein
MTCPQILLDLRKRPEMYLPVVTYEAAASFVLGYDAALQGGLLLGFREWLVTQLKQGSNLSWSVLALELIRQRAPESISVNTSPMTDNHSAAVDGLLSTIETFLRERNQTGGARRIFATYGQWLEQQDWYGPSSPDWIPKGK